MQDLWLCLSAALAGAINSVAGGGTLLTFPALDWALGRTAEGAVIANGTSTIAVFPGAAGGAWGYGQELAGSRRWIRLLLLPSFLGSIIGAWLLVSQPPETFKQLVPWLILLATFLFLLQPWIAKQTGIGQPHAAPTNRTVMGIIVFQFFVGIYGGYFGAGIGILMLSALAMMGLSDIHKMNGLKSLLGAVINGVAAGIFVLQDKVAWRYAVPMMIAAVIGGFVGASIARRLNRALVRGAVVVIGFTLSGYYLFQTYARG